MNNKEKETLLFVLQVLRALAFVAVAVSILVQIARI